MTTLHKLLCEMNPILRETDLVYIFLQDTLAPPPNSFGLGTFQEAEGLTIILRREDADKCNYNYESTWARITLNVYSSLEAVGFITYITSTLVEYGISNNVFSVFHHDHLLVPSSRAPQAMEVLA